MKNRGRGKGMEKEELAAARRGRSGRAGTDEDDEAVEELLRSAQDEITLKLSVDSHISKTPNDSDSLPSDLRRRFAALKSAPTASSASSSAALKSAPPSSAAAAQSQDDLMARFDALRVKGRSGSGSGAAPALPSPDLIRSGGFGTGDLDHDEDEEDEVEKIIRWAKDAACLDPSPPSDSDDCHSDEDDDGDVTD